MTEHKTKVLMLFIHAGGAGKTSTARDIGAELAARGNRVLLVDLDAQANLTTWLGIYDARPEQTLEKALMEYADPPEPVHVRENLDLLPSHLRLAKIEAMLPGMGNPEGRLKAAVDKLRASGRWDYIVLDAPPSLGKMTANAANAADWMIVPMPARIKGLNAIEGVREAMTEYGRTNPELRVAMYLVTQMDQTKVAREVMEAFKQTFGDKLAGPTTVRPAIYANCQAEGRPIDGSSRDEKDARAEIVAITDTLLERIGGNA